jgi:hypothetical protein
LTGAWILRRTMMFRPGAQYKARTVAAQLTGLLLSEVASTYSHNLGEIFLVMLIFILDIVLVGFLEI